jgi:hypothetical protein
MITQSTIRFSKPVTIDLRIATSPRPRVVQPDAATLAEDSTHVPEWHEFEELPFYLHYDAAAREIRAHLAPIPHALPLYGPADFAAAAADTMENHAARVLQLLGTAPASALQALCDGTELPAMPPRVPREIANWRARAVLELAGLLSSVESALASMDGPEGIIVRHAWQSGAPLARRGPTVSALAPALGLSEEQVDSMFIQGAALTV